MKNPIVTVAKGGTAEKSYPLSQLPIPARDDLPTAMRDVAVTYGLVMLAREAIQGAMPLSKVWLHIEWPDVWHDLMYCKKHYKAQAEAVEQLWIAARALRDHIREVLQ